MDIGLPPKVGTRTPNDAMGRAKSTFGAGAVGTTPAAAVTVLPRRLWASYVSALQTSPLRTKLGSAFAIFSGTDVAMQALAWRQQQQALAPDGAAGACAKWFIIDGYDPVRTAKMACFGICATAFVSAWWGVLEPAAARVFCPVTSRLPNALLKVVADQLFGASVFNLMFFVQTALIEGRGVDGAVARVRQRWWPQMLTHWTFWPAFHTLNFYFAPFHLRILYQNIAAVGWSSLLSRAADDAAAEDDITRSEPGQAAEGPRPSQCGQQANPEVSPSRNPLDVKRAGRQGFQRPAPAVE